MTMYACTDDVVVIGTKFTVDYEYEWYTCKGEQEVFVFMHDIKVANSKASVFHHLSEQVKDTIRDTLIEDIKEAAR